METPLTASQPQYWRKVPAHGTRRRLQALAVTGWSLTQLSARFPIHRDTLGHIMNGEPYVSWRTALTVAAAYDELWDVDPASRGVSAESIRQTKLRAAKAGWAPAMAWDDDLIDDPDAIPDIGETGFRYLALWEDSSFLMSAMGGALTFRQAALRLGVDTEYLHTARRRAVEVMAAVGVAEEAESA